MSGKHHPGFFFTYCSIGFLSIACWLTLVTPGVVRSEEAAEGVKSALGFAAELHSAGDYYRAMDELLPIVLADPNSEPGFLLLLHSAYKLEQPEPLQRLVKNLSALNDLQRMQLLQTLGLIALKQGSYEEGTNYLKQTDPTQNGLQDILTEAPFSKNKARQLSRFLPGAGFMYTREYGKAVGAFLLNALFIFLAYDSYRQENYGGMLLFGFFEYQFYTGGINAAGESAEKRNREIKEKAVQDYTAKLEVELFSF